MKLKEFSMQSGFKVLAMARLSQTEYSIVLYLINCSASALDEVITTDSELSSLIGYDEVETRKALENLSNRKLIKVKYGQPHANPDIDSLRLGMHFNTKDWHLDFNEDVTYNDAVVFPFRRKGESPLHLLNDPNSESNLQVKKKATWFRVYDSFVQDRDFTDEEIDQTEAAAKMLIDTHPVDQVLLIVRHFRDRIPTLSLLASSWQHYQELLETETQKVDLLGARKKHLEIDENLRKAAKDFLNSEFSTELKDEERNVLDILIKHQYPRRQLFWAYQTRSRYPNLNAFFSDNASLMLSVTNSGKLVHAPKPTDDD